MAGVYQTKQKDIILKCLSELPSQPFSAKDIYSVCKQNKTPVGLATIYRQLDCLIGEGKIKKIVADDNKGMHFQFLDTAAHSDAFFLKCDQCGEITNAECGLLDKMAVHMSEEHGFQIDTTRSVLYGRCKKCT